MVMEFNLKRILRALLLSTSDPLSIKDIQGVFTRFHAEAEKFLQGDDAQDGDSGAVAAESSTDPDDGDAGEPQQAIMRELILQVPSLLTATQIREALEEIDAEAIAAGEVWRIQQGPSGFRLAVAADFSEWVRLLRNEPRPMRLSPAALEVLAIVAYRQPVTRAEIESIRGVSSDSAVNRLIDLEMVVVSGRADAPGRPIQYATTDKFLEFIGVRSLDELPASDVLSAAQISEWIRNASMQESADDESMGLADKTETQQAELVVDQGSGFADAGIQSAGFKAEEEETSANQHQEDNK